MKPFLLVGGMPRSGTTLLETVLGSHSRVAMPPGDYPFAEQHAKGLSVQRIFEILSTKAPWELWEEKDFSSLFDKDHGEAFGQSMLMYARRMNKDIPAAKSPYSEFFYDTYRGWLADFDVKFVQVVRNPFDVIASIKNSQFHKNLRAFTDVAQMQATNWRRSTSIGLARRAMDPANYYLLRYEDFVDEPVSYGRALCSFLGLEFEEERMLNRADYTYHDTNTSFPDSGSDDQEAKPYIYRSESRKSFLDESEVGLIGSVCGEIARSLGYEDDDFRILPPEYSKEMKSGVRWRARARRVIGKVFGGGKAG